MVAADKPAYYDADDTSVADAFVAPDHSSDRQADDATVADAFVAPDKHTNGDADDASSWQCFAGNADAACAGQAPGHRLNDQQWCWDGAHQRV